MLILHRVVTYSFDWTFLSAVSDAIIAVFSVLIWRVYRHQLTTMTNALAETRASNEIAERAFEIGRRAWVVITDIGEPDLGNSRVLTTMKNVGEIPATDVAGEGFVTVVLGSLSAQASVVQPSSRPKEIEISSPIAPGRAVLAPGHSASGYLLIHGLDDQAVAIKVAKGEATLVLYQKVTYTDWFQKTRTTTAYWQYVSGRGWLVTPKGNAVD
jgi:hypothetical protein